MALNNYSNLKAAIIRWSHRTDIADSVDDFIDLTEAEFYKVLRIRDMEARSTASVSTTSRYLELPDDYLEMRQFRLKSGGNDYDIEYKSPESMQFVNSAGKPEFFTITTQVEFNRIPDTDYTVEMQFYNELTSLDSTNTTNAVLTRFPNIYLYGCLYYLHIWKAEQAKAEIYRALFKAAIDEANRSDKKGRYGPVMAIRHEGMTP